MMNYPWYPAPPPPPMMDSATLEDITKLFDTDVDEQPQELNFSIEQQEGVPCLIVSSGGKRYKFVGSEASGNG